MTKPKFYYPSPLCRDCGKKLRTNEPQDMAITCWISECDVCKEIKSVTSSRHYGCPKVEVKDVGS